MLYCTKVKQLKLPHSFTTTNIHLETCFINLNPNNERKNLVHFFSANMGVPLGLLCLSLSSLQVSKSSSKFAFKISSPTVHATTSIHRGNLMHFSVSGFRGQIVGGKRSSYRNSYNIRWKPESKKWKNIYSLMSQ